MTDLKDALDLLHELDELRDQAKELRERGRLALKDIENTATTSHGKVRLDAVNSDLRETWISSGNNVEVALLVKVQNHKDMSEDDEENDRSEAAPLLKKRLEGLKLEDLFPSPEFEAEIKEEDIGDRRVPVLVAARAMQALVSRSESVFSEATMLCYYRIVRELYMAARPDWTIGAARAGMGGTTSAFVTGECIRAIFAFEDAMKRTARFFQQTSRLLGRYELLSSMLNVLQAEPPSTIDQATSNTRELTDDANNERPPIDDWADKAIERMWFDWYVSTNPRNGNMALHLGNDGNQLFFQTSKPVDMKSVSEYLAALQEKLRMSVEAAKTAITEAKKEIDRHRVEIQAGFFVYEKKGKRWLRKPRTEPSNQDEWLRYYKRLREYDRAESAHKFAFGLIEKAESEAGTATGAILQLSLKDTLDDLGRQFTEMSGGIHKVLEPAKRYIRTVLHREVAAAAFGRFDAGELVFAAASYGAITDWKPSELLSRACALLTEVLPENGRLPTTRPFHSTLKGHRMLPIGCEMTRSLAQLLQKTNHDIEPKLVRRMLNIFEEKLIILDYAGKVEEKKRVAWNFDGSPDPNSPCIWVTAVSVLAIDRVVRMLNERINSIVFKYFEVIKPEKPHSALTLNDLVYPDHGLSKYRRPPQPSIALRLEQMRAHVMRVALPEIYRDEKGERERLFSGIFYGPPGTGKTTLVEALALTSRVPLIRLSPSDLVVQGPAAIEARARSVFEALSMLTQVVIILDEFEDVVGHRGQSDNQTRDEKIFEFLRMGMLPKLVKLNDSARKQSFAYCLATNYLAKIDPAAKRKGRFNLHLPVYDPDPMSRAGTLLYRLYRVAQRLEHDGDFAKESKGLAMRFLEVVEMTSNTHASSLADDYLRLPEWVINHDISRPENYENDVPFFWYVLKEEDKGYNKKKELLIEESQRTREETEKFKSDASKDELRESDWLDAYENKLGSAVKKGTEIPLEDMWSCLIGPPYELKKAASPRFRGVRYNLLKQSYPH